MSRGRGLADDTVFCACARDIFRGDFVDKPHAPLQQQGQAHLFTAFSIGDLDVSVNTGERVYKESIKTPESGASSHAPLMHFSWYLTYPNNPHSDEYILYVQQL